MKSVKIIYTRNCNSFAISLTVIGLLVFSFRYIKDAKLSYDEIEHIDYNSFWKWIDSIEGLKFEDGKRTKKLFRQIKENMTKEEIKDHFYHLVNMPLQSVCTVGKYFGGVWLSECGAVDGNKYVCLDRLYGDILNGRCLIYSFGIADDWSFETIMADMGCTIKAFDPTSNPKMKPKSDKITFSLVGLSTTSENVSGFGSVMTLKDAVASMNDTGKRISYLKVDIEGSELKVMPEWIDSGILNYVDQFGIEIHLPQRILGEMKTGLKGLLKVFRKLYKIGFRLIAQTNNDCVGKSQDPEGVYVNYFELVFYKKKRTAI